MNNDRRGKQFERETCILLSDYFGFVIQRNLGQARDSGNDITLKKHGEGHIRIENKRRRRILAERWLEQCEKACKPGDTPIVIMRSDGGESMCLMRLKDALPLIREELKAI